VIRHSFAFGRRHRFGVLKPDRVTRLFPQGSVTWTGEVHERPVLTIPLRALPGHLEHHTYSDWAQHQTKLIRYTEQWAKSAWEQGRRAGRLAPWLRAGAGFLKMFGLNLGFLGGPASWALCWRHGCYTLTKSRNLAALSRRAKA
jgi:hypothetical protein